MNDNQKQTQEQKDARAKTEERLQALEETGMSRREASFADIFGDDAFDDAAEVEGVDVDKAREIVRESRKEHEEEIARELDAQEQHRTEIAVKIVAFEVAMEDWYEAERLGLALRAGGSEAQHEHFVVTSYAYDLARIAAQKNTTNEAGDNKSDAIDSIKVGDYVRVEPHTVYQHLVGNAVVSPPREHQHEGYSRVKVIGVHVTDEHDRSKDVVEVAVGDGMVDEVQRTACRKL